VKKKRKKKNPGKLIKDEGRFKKKEKRGGTIDSTFRPEKNARNFDQGDRKALPISWVWEGKEGRGTRH